MRSFEKLLGRLLIIALGCLLFIIGLLISSVISRLVAAALLSFVSSTILGHIVSLLYGIFFTVDLLLSIYSMFAIATFYHSIKRDWLIEHGLAVEATSQGVYYYEDRLDYVLTLTWQSPQSKHIHTFTRTIQDDELRKVIHAIEGQFVVIFDPDAPMFYEVQLPSGRTGYPRLIMAVGQTRNSGGTSSDQENTGSIKSRGHCEVAPPTVDGSQLAPRLLAATSTTSSFAKVHDESGWRQTLCVFVQLVLFSIYTLRFIADIAKLRRVWRARADEWL